uniref:Uncharacterized protein n=1 Tax=Magnetospirillum gryphiswaldense TaxID=55518 RepID=A4U4L2_9PROT|nr:hypothetical protein MGR_3887 [Magnetospirillum gryphiswaldense MSR-1]
MTGLGDNGGGGIAAAQVTGDAPGFPGDAAQAPAIAPGQGQLGGIKQGLDLRLRPRQPGGFHVADQQAGQIVQFRRRLDSNCTRLRLGTGRGRSRTDAGVTHEKRPGPTLIEVTRPARRFPCAGKGARSYPTPPPLTAPDKSAPRP